MITDKELFIPAWRGIRTAGRTGLLDLKLECFPQPTMSKRARASGGSLTGGTGDVKPQILTLSSGIGVVNEYIVTNSPLPVPRFGSMKNMATVVEFLKVWWYMGIIDLTDQLSTDYAFLATGSRRVSGETGLLTSLNVDLNDPKTFAIAVQNGNFTTSGATERHLPIEIDLTDSNGNGVIIATDNIFLVAANINGTQVTSYVAKVLYRLVNIGVTEYVGIVQSQQG